MKVRLTRRHLVPVAAFVLGVFVGCGGLMSLMVTRGTSAGSRKREASAFFYRTMQSVFDGRYEPEPGLVSPKALDVIEEYGLQRDGACYLLILQKHLGGRWHDGLVFFPSGNFFEVQLLRTPQRRQISALIPISWERHWEEVLPSAGG